MKLWTKQSIMLRSHKILREGFNTCFHRHGGHSIRGSLTGAWDALPTGNLEKCKQSKEAEHGLVGHYVYKSLGGRLGQGEISYEMKYYHAQACFQSISSHEFEVLEGMETKSFQRVVVGARKEDGHWSYGVALSR